MQGLGLFFIGVSVFGWFGFFFAGSGHAALIAIAMTVLLGLAVYAVIHITVKVKSWFN